MRKLLTVAAAVLLLFGALPMGAAVATPPVDVEFDATVFFPPPSTGFFTASGTAVNEGLMCASGTTLDLLEKQSGNSGMVLNVQVIAEFTCGEGDFQGDTFIMKLQNQIDSSGHITGRWVLQGGTGAFEDLHGTGYVDGYMMFVPELPFPIGVHELRTGSMHLD